jgi:DNA-binding response OmpR family regulator
MKLILHTTRAWESNPVKEILIVEDDQTIAMGIEYALTREGFSTHLCYDFHSAREAILGRDFLLILLDVNLPGGNGFDLCKLVRSKGDTPVIFLTVCDDEVNTIMGLDLGADDYIAKPFGDSEVLARVRAVLRRPPLADSQRQARTHIIRFAGWTMDLRRRELYAPSGAAVTLSAAEFDLLSNLVEHPQQIIGRERLLELARFRLPGSSDRSIDVLISRLRNKLGGDGNAEIIRTVRGFGYMFATDVERS